MKRLFVTLLLLLYITSSFLVNVSANEKEVTPVYGNIINAGRNSWMAIDTKGNLLAGGYKQASAAPNRSDTDVLVVSSNYEHTMIIKFDGSLWGWGSNKYGQLGIEKEYKGKEKKETTPKKIMDNVVFVSTGYSHTAAIKNDGSLWVWGGNEFGEIGDGTSENRSEPVKIMESVKLVSAGYNFTMAIKEDGSLWAWGNNQYGQLGDGYGGKQGIFTLTPTKIMESVDYVSTAKYNVLAIKEDNSLWFWGTRATGDLKSEMHNKPVRFMDSVKAVSASVNHSMAIKIDGSLWGWGDNFNGQLGDDTCKFSPVPLKVMDSVVAVSTTDKNTIALKTDGSLWAWGNNMANAPTLVMNDVSISIESTNNSIKEQKDEYENKYKNSSFIGKLFMTVFGKIGGFEVGVILFFSILIILGIINDGTPALVFLLISFVLFVFSLLNTYLFIQVASPKLLEYVNKNIDVNKLGDIGDIMLSLLSADGRSFIFSGSVVGGYYAFTAVREKLFDSIWRFVFSAIYIFFGSVLGCILLSTGVIGSAAVFSGVFFVIDNLIVPVLAVIVGVVWLFIKLPDGISYLGRDDDGNHWFKDER